MVPYTRRDLDAQTPCHLPAADGQKGPANFHPQVRGLHRENYAILDRVPEYQLRRAAAQSLIPKRHPVALLCLAVPRPRWLTCRQHSSLTAQRYGSWMTIDGSTLSKLLSLIAFPATGHNASDQVWKVAFPACSDLG